MYDVHTVTFTSLGDMTFPGLPSQLTLIDEKPDNASTVTTIVIPSAKKTPGWVYIVAPLIGLLLLIFIVVGLQCVSFNTIYTKIKIP